MSSQGNIKGHVFQTQACITITSIFMFYLYFLAWDDSVSKQLETSITLTSP